MRRVRLIVTALAVLCVSVQAAPPTKGSTGETAITDCQIIQQPGSYVLSQNLPGTRGLLPKGDVSDYHDCLLIAVSNVSIDGKGFTITGDGSFGDGIRTGASSTVQNIEIRNVRIEKFYDGVALDAAFSIVENVTALDNVMWGIYIYSGQQNSLQQNRVSNCNANGNGKGIELRTTSIITNNIANSNDYTGIHVDGSSVVTGNIANGNGDVGIAVACPSLVQGNVATGNTTDDYSDPSGTGGCVSLDNVSSP